ncbi:MAG TPA: recombinase family protein [Thermoprotei archaeon]|nr:recombinase family protein [Thermoprotei archaeon]
MKAVVYSRVSTEEQDPDSQLQDILDYATNKGYNIDEVFEENISGSTNPFDRPIFKELLRYISKYEIDVILMHDLTRFYRPPPGKVSETLSMLREIIDNYHVLIEFVSEPRIEDPMLSELWRFLKSWISAYERLQISMRTRYGLLRIRREGRLYHKPDIVYYYAAWIYGKDLGSIDKREYQTAKKQLIKIVERYWRDGTVKKTRIGDLLIRNELREMYIRFPSAPKSYVTFYRLMNNLSRH